MSALCSLERAKLNIPAVTTADDRVVAGLIAACSAAIEKYLKRRITLAEHDELYDGADRLILRHYPVHRVDSVRGFPQVVLELNNTSTATTQQARAEVQREGMRLVRVASGTMSVDTSVTWASNATLAAAATAITALGSGWSARVIGSQTGDYGLWPSRDLWIAPGVEGDGGSSFDCRGRWAGLTLHVTELAGYAFDARGVLYRRDPWADLWPLAAGGGFEGGPGVWRVRYTAGYAEVPAAIEEACAEWVAELFQVTKRDPTLGAQGVVGAGQSSYLHQTMPERVKGLLAPWRAYRV